jgi:NitT/TauT family transport system permease protein
VLNGDLFFHLQFTLTAMIAGYLLGVTVGLSVAILFGLVYYLYRVTEPVVLMIYSIPSVAIGPLLIIWFGIGMLPKIILAAFFVFFVVFMNTVTGIRNVNPSLIDIALVMGASRRDIVRKIVIPGAYPYIITALRITLPTALIGAVVGEFISSNRGIAYLIMESSMTFNTDGTFGALIVLGIVVVLLNSILTPLENRLMRHLPKVEAVQ